ncbi:hypothetical protein MTO96_002896 [Rhipicephalus appendiculatus]
MTCVMAHGSSRMQNVQAAIIQLELPSVHFLCGHSYHQQCFENYAENDTDCPECLPQHSKVLDILRSQEQSRNLHEDFHHQVGTLGKCTCMCQL